MACREIDFRHIVDVNGPLFAINAEKIGTSSLLAKVNKPTIIRSGSSDRASA